MINNESLFCKYVLCFSLNEEVVTNPQQNIIGNVIEEDSNKNSNEGTSVNNKILYYICGV